MTESDSEEEILVYAEFDSGVNVRDYRNIHVLGINEQNPVIQMDNDFFQGKYVNPMGTYMFFTEDPTVKSSDPLYETLPQKNLKYVDKTRKCISMEHAYISQKNCEDQDIKQDCETIKEEIQTFKFKNVQEAIDTFKKEFGNNISQNTLEQNVNILHSPDEDNSMDEK